MTGTALKTTKRFRSFISFVVKHLYSLTLISCTLPLWQSVAGTSCMTLSGPSLKVTPIGLPWCATHRTKTAFWTDENNLQSMCSSLILHLRAAGSNPRESSLLLPSKHCKPVTSYWPGKHLQRKICSASEDDSERVGGLGGRGVDISFIDFLIVRRQPKLARGLRMPY